MVESAISRFFVAFFPKLDLLQGLRHCGVPNTQQKQLDTA